MIIGWSIRERWTPAFAGEGELDPENYQRAIAPEPQKSWAAAGPQSKNSGDPGCSSLFFAVPTYASQAALLV